MMTLAEYVNCKHYLFLYSFLNLGYAEYNYKIAGYNVSNHVVTAEFEQAPSNLKYVQIQKARRVRVAFASLQEYALKENRNGLRVDIEENRALFTDSISALDSLGSSYERYNKLMEKLLSEEQIQEGELRHFVSRVPDFSTDAKVIYARSRVHMIMDNTALCLGEMWDDSRYSRDITE